MKRLCKNSSWSPARLAKVSFFGRRVLDAVRIQETSSQTVHPEVVRLSGCASTIELVYRPFGHRYGDKFRATRVGVSTCRLKSVDRPYSPVAKDIAGPDWHQRMALRIGSVVLNRDDSAHVIGKTQS